MKLNTIQKREKLNEVSCVYEHNGYGYAYVINGVDKEFETIIDFQEGARHLETSKHGVIDSDLLEIVRDRLNRFQAGPFRSRENAIALTHIEEALLWLNKRVEDRAERGVLGTENK